MSNTPNYGWDTPDNTGLVKNGALDMRTLGNAIDTSVWNVGYGQAAKNKTTNAAMQVWQRGTSFAVTTPVYAADRWQVARAGNVAGSTVTRQLTSDTTNLPFIQYCMRVSRDSGNTSTNTLYLAQAMESVNSIPLAGRTVTVSFYARKGANYSATSSIINVKLQSGTGTDQNNLTGAYTGSTNVTNQNAVLTTTWQRFSSTGTIAATATELAYLIEANPTGTAGAADYYEITGIQLEVGSVATAFQTASGGSIQGELAMCQRYYEEVPFRERGDDDGNTDVFMVFYKVQKRTTPSSTIAAGGTTPTVANEYPSGCALSITGQPYDTVSTVKSSAEL